MFRLRFATAATTRRLYSTAITRTTITFFSKDNCQLCEKAKLVLSNIQQKQPQHDYKYIDITKPENVKWHDMYVYDIPVLHIDREEQVKPIKFMHRFDEDEILEELTQEL